jgi:hypothetical protein
MEMDVKGKWPSCSVWFEQPLPDSVADFDARQERLATRSPREGTMAMMAAATPDEAGAGRISRLGHSIPSFYGRPTFHSIHSASMIRTDAAAAACLGFLHSGSFARAERKCACFSRRRPSVPETATAKSLPTRAARPWRPRRPRALFCFSPPGNAVSMVLKTANASHACDRMKGRKEKGAPHTS